MYAKRLRNGLRGLKKPNTNCRRGKAVFPSPMLDLKGTASVRKDRLARVNTHLFNINFMLHRCLQKFGNLRVFPDGHAERGCKTQGIIYL